MTTEENLRQTITAINEDRAGCVFCRNTERCPNGKYCPHVGVGDYLREIDRRLPAKFRDVTLGTLKPNEASLLPLPLQAAVLEQLRKQPLNSYAFFSPPRYGKTTFTTALYKHAVWEREVINPNYDALVVVYGNIGVWRVSAPALVLQHQLRWESHKLPEVTEEMIAKIGQRQVTPRLFLEEIDKFNVTPFARLVMFNIIKAIDEANGQLVINSNLTVDEFRQRFEEDCWVRIQRLCGSDGIKNWW